MARIRSIKPEFWKDGRIARLSPGCALFFIGLWNFCDDEGKHRVDPQELAHSMPRFRTTDVSKHIRRLTEEGLIRISRGTHWLQVENWQHQKIDKPRQPKVKKEDIEWNETLRREHSPNCIRHIFEPSDSPRRKDRIGKDRIGKDGIGYTPTPQAGNGDVPLGNNLPSKKLEKEPVTSSTWEAYKNAYLERYKTEPVRNATVNGMLARFVNRIGKDDAPQVIEFYVWHPKAFYVQNGHQIRFALADAEKLVTEWKTKKFVTTKQAHREEELAGTRLLLDEIERDGI